MPSEKTAMRPEVATFKTMRVGVGILGISLPLIMIGSSLIIYRATGLLNSISAYYNSPMREIYVAVVCMIAFFLLCYKGYDRKDNWSCNIAGLLAFGIAFFPTIDNSQVNCEKWDFVIGQRTVDWMHTVFASLFFCILSYISIFLFTQTHEGVEIAGIKKGKNIIFVASGLIIAAALLLLLLINTTDILGLKGSTVTLVLEALMLVSFGISWLVKGVF
jgi:hypothetical protein